MDIKGPKLKLKVFKRLKKLIVVYWLKIDPKPGICLKYFSTPSCKNGNPILTAALKTLKEYSWPGSQPPSTKPGNIWIPFSGCSVKMNSPGISFPCSRHCRIPCKIANTSVPMTHTWDYQLVMHPGRLEWPWVGIHERSAHEKINTGSVAHALNDEVTRKWIQSIKRLMTFCQKVYPPSDPSKAMG